MTTFFYGYLFLGLPGANPQKVVPHGPHNNKCACFLVHAVYYFFYELFIYFHFRVKKYETRKKYFLRVIFLFISRHPRKLVNSFAIIHFFLRLFISRGARQLVK